MRKGLITQKDILNVNFGSLLMPLRKKKVSLRHSERFHKKKNHIMPWIMQTIGPDEIVYGSYAVNKQLPNWLDVPANDIDVFSYTPKKDAEQAERHLDSKFGGDYFYVKRARHPSTWRVVAHANGKAYVDFTRPENCVPHRTIDGKNYITLPYAKQHIEETLQDPFAWYRHDRDRDTLHRIILHQKRRGYR